jgi:hypothetical protein
MRPSSRADLGDPPQKRRHRFAGRHRIFRKAVAEIRHRVLETIGQFPRAGDRLRHVGEERRHLRRRLEVALGVDRQPPARLRDRRLVADAGQDVVERTIGRLREADAIRTDEGNMKSGREIEQPMVVCLFVAPEMALELDVHVLAPEDADETIDQAADAVPRARKRLAADERDEAAGVPVQLLEPKRSRPLRRRELHARDQPAEIPVALARAHENGEAPAGTGAWGLGLRA